MNVYKVVGSRRVAHVAPGGEVTEQQIAAAGGSVSHLIASGHIAAVEPPQVASEPPAPVARARKAASTSIPVDEADSKEQQ